MSLEIDLTPFWESLNEMLPVILPIFAAIAGIPIAIALARLIVKEIRGAFGGGR